VKGLQWYNLWHEDRTAAAQGVEARVPFLDRRLVEYLAAIPTRHHPRLFWNKHIVRAMAARWVPPWLRERPKVPLFGTAVRSSMWRIYADMVQRVFPQFREKYLEADPMFDAERMSLVPTGTQPGPEQGRTLQLLLKCMAMAIFRRLCSVNSSHAEIRRYAAPSPLRAVSSVAEGPWRWA
jgi:asparagine synthase (glutamine-hydrolysing)